MFLVKKVIYCKLSSFLYMCFCVIAVMYIVFRLVCEEELQNVSTKTMAIPFTVQYRFINEILFHLKPALQVIDRQACRIES